MTGPKPATLAALTPAERADRLLPVTDDEQRWPECPDCGGELILIGLRMACADCSAVMGLPEPPEQGE